MVNSHYEPKLLVQSCCWSEWCLNTAVILLKNRLYFLCKLIIYYSGISIFIILVSRLGLIHTYIVHDHLHLKWLSLMCPIYIQMKQTFRFYVYSLLLNVCMYISIHLPTYSFNLWERNYMGKSFWFFPSHLR